MRKRMFMFVDAHAHLCDEMFIDFRSANDIDAIITSSYSVKNMERCMQLSADNDKYYTTLGIHPQYCYEYNDEVEKFICDCVTSNNLDSIGRNNGSFNEINDISKDKTFNREMQPKIVGIGEIGLDKNYDTNFEYQKDIFVKQLNLAEKLQLPVVCHIRNCYDVFFDIIKDYKNLSFMIHAFSGIKNDCFKALDLGGNISFACNITYKRHIELRKLASIIPLEQILIETDSPSMLPASFLRKGYNTPNNVRFVAETIATERRTSIETIARATKENAIQFFSLGISAEN